MNTVGSRIKPEIYQRWLLRPATQRLLALEAGWLRDWVSQLHGCHLLYSGIDAEPRFLQRSRLQHSFRMGLPWARGVVDPQGEMADGAWPFADESLDVVVLQHSLDMSHRPHQMIREAARTVMPNGYLIVVGFNPYSWWGGMRWLRTFSTELPWLTHPVSESRLRDWLLLLDFRVEQVSPVAHAWPLNIISESVSRRIDRVLAGTRWLPANAYVLVARKTVAGLTPIRPRRWQLAEAGFGLATPVASSVAGTQTWGS